MQPEMINKNNNNMETKGILTKYIFFFIVVIVLQPVPDI